MLMRGKKDCQCLPGNVDHMNAPFPLQASHVLRLFILTIALLADVTR